MSFCNKRERSCVPENVPSASGINTFRRKQRGEKTTPFPVCLSKLLDSPRPKWETNIKIGPEEVRYEAVDGFSWLEIRFGGRIS
jgi:hypothetical protein